MSGHRVLICGSMAFDTIMVFEGRFKDQILPEQMHILNVCFLVPSLRKDWGGCAGNIAYSLHMLGGHAVPMATVGHDGKDYIQRLAQMGMDTTHLTLVDGEFTAQAFVTTDLDNNQITAFHPGAMAQSHVNSIGQANGEFALGILAPDGRQGMIEHAEQFASAGIPFVFDPGQGLPMFGKAELNRLIELASYATVNDYEAKLLCNILGETPERLASRLKALFITRGAEGSWVYTDGQRLEVPCVKAERIADPTGCGDAYRAGLLHGLVEGMPVLQAAQLASLMGSLKIMSKGGQNHWFERQEIAIRFKTAFGHLPW